MTQKERIALLKILVEERQKLYAYRYNEGITDEDMEDEETDEIIWLRGRYYELTTIISKLSKTFNLGEDRK